MRGPRFGAVKVRLAVDKFIGPGWILVLVFGVLVAPGLLVVLAGFAVNCPPKFLRFRLFRAWRALSIGIAGLTYSLKLSV